MTEQFVLPKGTLVHVCGWPVALTADTIIETNPGNWGLIQTDLHARASSIQATRKSVMGLSGNIIVLSDEEKARLREGQRSTTSGG